ncbi:DUF1990 family protein [Deinococcus sp. PEB2-63]
MPLIVPTVQKLERLRARGQTRATNGVTSGDLIHEVVEVGRGEAVFRRAAAALRRWDTHCSWWLRVHPADEPPAPWQTVVIQVQAGRFSPLALAFCDRVTDVIDGPRRCGWCVRRWRGCRGGRPVNTCGPSRARRSRRMPE